jgi:hypothetical protein
LGDVDRIQLEARVVEVGLDRGERDAKDRGAVGERFAPAGPEQDFALARRQFVVSLPRHPGMMPR